ncbi:MAG: hypothetical protein LIO51_06540, partial [Clostridiales bacterium]|nr:hypothetical protein [Clostridiales bacterium]
TSTSYTDKTAKSGTTYYYSVRAYRGSYSSSYVTNRTIVRLAQPSVTLSKVSGGVKVSWGKVSGATKYRVYRKTAGASSWTTIKSSTTSTNYTDTTAKSGTTYYYSVRAYRGSSYSSYVTNKSITR